MLITECRRQTCTRFLGSLFSSEYQHSNCSWKIGTNSTSDFDELEGAFFLFQLSCFLFFSVWIYCMQVCMFACVDCVHILIWSPTMCLHFREIPLCSFSSFSLLFRLTIVLIFCLPITDSKKLVSIVVTKYCPPTWINCRCYGFYY